MFIRGYAADCLVEVPLRPPLLLTPATRCVSSGFGTLQLAEGSAYTPPGQQRENSAGYTAE